MALLIVWLNGLLIIFIQLEFDGLGSVTPRSVSTIGPLGGVG